MDVLVSPEVVSVSVSYWAAAKCFCKVFRTVGLKLSYVSDGKLSWHDTHLKKVSKLQVVSHTVRSPQLFRVRMFVQIILLSFVYGSWLFY